MIQNLIIVKEGAAVFKESFGHCHKLGSNPMLLSAFFDALVQFSSEFEQGQIEQLRFKEATVNFLKQKDLLFIAIADRKDRITTIQSKLRKTAKLFVKHFKNNLKNFSGEYTQFNHFRELLLEEEIVTINCGEHSNCQYCKNRENISSTYKEIINGKKALK
jgi:hypothetical protein